MFAPWITGVQRASSLSISALKSAGELPTGSMICAANFARSSGDWIASTTSSWIFFRIASGVPAGATSPFQASASTLDAGFLQRRHVGHQRRALRRRDREDLHRAGLRMRQTEIAGITAICTSPRITAVIACGEEP